MPTRREFLAAGAVALGSLRMSSSALRASEPGAPPSRRALSLLILGGTSFLGPHQIAYALERGHSVTIFTRGRTRPTVHPDLFSRVESLTGDRETDLSALRGRSWDAVIDNSGRQVEWTRRSAELLEERVGLYLYTSSTGVHYPYQGEELLESDPVVLEVPEGEEENGSYTYGVMKANSERAARRVFGDDRTIVVRPTYIMGPGDTTDRFAHWPVRLNEGGEVLVPGRPGDPVQFVDVRDLTQWMIRLVEDRRTGTFHGVGPAAPMGILDFVQGAHQAFDSQVEFTVVDDYAFLREHGVTAVLPWIMPVDDYASSARVGNARALSSGLTLRPVSATIRDVFEWWNSEAVEEDRRSAWTTDPRSLRAREAEILAAWKRRR
ncbi:MAG: NAD-dependent epimerase/dehydratase family protein [Gemmatimonadota bacterium]